MNKNIETWDIEDSVAMLPAFGALGLPQCFKPMLQIGIAAEYLTRQPYQPATHTRLAQPLQRPSQCKQLQRGQQPCRIGGRAASKISR